MTEIEFELNGTTVQTDVSPDTPLRDVLRDELDQLDVKEGCLSGRCGVCTVHLNGESVKSCLVMAGKADGETVTTVAGVGEDGQFNEVQEAFVDHFAAQCGYCTPGFVMSATEYVEENPDPDRDEIRDALKGNLCRCTGYEKIIDAVEDVASDAVGTADD
jgi:aerobic-type carbon monoxide dehydrogenase small subunit (CoxS/CutS family)